MTKERREKREDKTKNYYNYSVFSWVFLFKNKIPMEKQTPKNPNKTVIKPISLFLHAYIFNITNKSKNKVNKI